MQRVGALAIAALACIAVPTLLAPGALGAARAADRQPVAATLIMSRGHQILTVVLRNNSAAWACIDPNFAAPARVSAYARNARPIRNDNGVESARGGCALLGPRKTMHVVFDLRPMFPVGLPGDSRICYTSWWKMGGVQSLAPTVRMSHCLVLPAGGIGRR